MRKRYQLSLFGGGSGRGLLFDPRLLQQYLHDHRDTMISELEAKMARVKSWTTSLQSSPATESSLESKFITEILCGVLGYVAYPTEATEGASLYHKPSQRLTHIDRTPDVTLGKFSAADWRFDAVLELKTPGTKFEALQPSYGNETPVEQGFYYGSRILGVRWVLVSDMRVLRLYSIESDAEYEEVDLRECVDPANFRKMYFLFGYEYLIKHGEDSQIQVLFRKSTGRQLEIRDNFYAVYYTIRADLYAAIARAANKLERTPNRTDLLQAAQRLLDRMLFIYYCEDHPQRLIPHGTIAEVTRAARKLPGPDRTKVYKSLKLLFREIDEGSTPGSEIEISGYNGELFKDHWIIDHIDLPDDLHDQRFPVPHNGDVPRFVQGVWGLHEYDFWSELNEHLLGHIFEESLSDQHQLGSVETVTLHEKLQERKKGGVFFTTSILSDFLCASALDAILKERAPLAANAATLETLERRLAELARLQVIDLACGSGAFLVSAYRLMLQEYWRLRMAMDEARGARPDLFEHKESTDQARLLRDCLAGVDLMPQAVEIAKLALWLRSARKGEKVPDLSMRMLAADSLRINSLFELLGTQPGTFDLVIGNPPWGGEVAPDVRRMACQELGVDPENNWDSWELFVLLGLRTLREGGRLAFVLPDSLLYPEKARIRELIFQQAMIEKLHSLGPDWFGPNVRMGTTLLQARRGAVNANGQILCAMAAGSLRQRAILGEIPLTQIEAQRGRMVPIQRVLSSPVYEIEVFRGGRDDDIMNVMLAHGRALNELCEFGRGEEMNKSGLLWECPGCLAPTTPGEKKKGDGFEDKACPNCGILLMERRVRKIKLVEQTRPQTRRRSLFIDGDDIARRYQHVVPQKWLRLDLSGWKYKSAQRYSGEKILVRQAGVGLFATLDDSGARCPQSVYYYRLSKDFKKQGYKNEFVLAALLSRTMSFFVFKRFAEVDPAKAHAKLTHDRLGGLPVPIVNFGDAAQKELHDLIVKNVRKLLDGRAKLGEHEDRDIESALRQLWGLSPEDGAYINGEFYDLPESQAIRDLFPHGRPKPEGHISS